ncbi:hypothetical protein KBY99_00655 [Cyanobium sp. Maggiore-St4-Cus]|uniref:TRAFAC clade GTPase domain-containing protein n=1 Tax=Cyanobium sp. Maggiore-St4-Cus TaxID=2823717 RepID=UPI0020CC21E0|nr:hypothetical protein [Cyanobium sp. Maggiore-St4-Cus]MCP9787491.1 hypothetical protein [Cyanobium sp. Maggiore-St4-Cus]
MPTTTTDFNVLMLGSRGAGKTTLLAVMWDQLGSAIERSKGSFRYEHSTRVYLGHAAGELRRMYDSPGLSVSPGIAGTDTPRALSIQLYTQNHANAHLKINFWDYPGGLLNPESSTGVEAEAFQSRINDAHYFFVIVDAPALLEHDGRFHAIRNYPYPIQYMLHNRLRSDPRGAKVLFVVIKCEKYVKEGRSQEVFRAVQKGYSNLFLDIQGSYPQSSADICLVETLGSIVLDRLEPVMTASGQEYPRYHFNKISESAVHSPRNTALPLKLILDSAIFTSLAERRSSYEGLNWARDFLGRDDDLKGLLMHIRDLAGRASDSNAHLSLRPGT